MIQSPSPQIFFPWLWFYGPLPHSPCWLYSSSKTFPWLIHTSIRASKHGWSCAVPTTPCQPASVKQTLMLLGSHTTIQLHFCAPLIPPQSPRQFLQSSGFQTFSLSASLICLWDSKNNQRTPTPSFQLPAFLYYCGWTGEAPKPIPQKLRVTFSNFLPFLSITFSLSPEQFHEQRYAAISLTLKSLLSSHSPQATASPLWSPTRAKPLESNDLNLLFLLPILSKSMSIRFLSSPTPPMQYKANNLIHLHISKSNGQLSNSIFLPSLEALMVFSSLPPFLQVPYHPDSSPQSLKPLPFCNTHSFMITLCSTVAHTKCA